MMTKRGLADALRTAATSQEELFATAYEAMVSAVSTLLEANVRAGSARAGLDPETVLRALSGLLHLNPGGDRGERDPEAHPPVVQEDVRAERSLRQGRRPR